MLVLKCKQSVKKNRIFIRFLVLFCRFPSELDGIETEKELLLRRLKAKISILLVFKGQVKRKRSNEHLCNNKMYNLQNKFILLLPISFHNSFFILRHGVSCVGQGIFYFLFLFFRSCWTLKKNRCPLTCRLVNSSSNRSKEYNYKSSK